MTSSKRYFARTSYRFLTSDRDAPITSDSVFDLDESDVWNSGRSSSSEFLKPVQSSRVLKKAATRRGGGASVGSTPASVPVNIPDWSKILKEDYKEHRRRDGDDDLSGGDDDGGEEEEDDRIPPHEFLARQSARTRIASFSLHEGFGRTLKGRDLSTVRNAIWEKTGFQD
ncbi:hypothetical protein U1Q18_020992 [Sarracenia purpurea var. burkii]